MSISIRRPCVDDTAAFIDAVRRSHALHQPWVSPPNSPEAFSVFLKKYDGQTNICYLAVDETDELVGCINLNEIVRGAFNSAYLGYYGFTPRVGKGLMKRALCLVADEAFGALRLHRMEANIQPGNAASLGLVRALGFRHEGFSPKYLFVDGAWRDHERFAITAEDWATR